MGNDVSTGRAGAERSRLLWVLAIVGLAALVRFIGLNFDQNNHFHPDERAIADAVGRISFDPSNLQLNPQWFNYGTFPIYVTSLVNGLLGQFDSFRNYDSTILIGRGVTAAISTLTVWLLIGLGTRLYNRQVGLLAGALLGACVLHVQNSRFMTTDNFLTFVVLVALYALIGVVQRGRWRDYIFAGFVIGLAGATKFSAMPLLAPLGVALLVRSYREGSIVPLLGKGFVALFAVFAGFAIGQPYALLDFDTFQRHIAEQGRMVRSAGLLPYTNQYIGAPKYLYELQQIVLWCMGPALGLAAIWATARQVVGLARSRSGEHLVLLSWVVPYFLVTGWFEVKFVRYLLPIYPIVILWAAAWLWGMAQRSRIGRAAMWTVLGMTLAFLLAHMSIYLRPHTIVTASDWVYRHVPPGSTMVTQHWDEGFPFHLPGRQRADVKVIELPYYDGEIKMRSISEDLAKADYLAFQTNRLYGAITRAPDKYRLTNNYFYLLFAGDLGYTIVYDYGSRPSLFGFELPDELADESISVYDHPKVLIFQNTGHLSADEIYDKVTRGMPSRRLTRTDLMLARAGEAALDSGGAAEPIRSSLLALILFAALVEVLGLAAYPILRRWLPVPGAYALAKVFGVLVFAWVPWLLCSYGQVDFTRGTLGVTAVGLVLIGVLAHRRTTTAAGRAEWRPAELLFWGAFIFFLAVRAFNPEAYWGEKPMDFAFLNSLTRATRLPPPEPWFAGSTLHYSYFGHYIVAALGKLCNIHPGITFNLGIALFAGLTAAAAFAAGCALSDRWRVGVLAAVFTTLIGNLAGPREAIARKVFNFDYFWATSRVIKDTINEYPFWSFLFADLHAHVLVMPFSLTFVALAIWWVRRHDVTQPIRALALYVLLALALGAIMITNTWSTFTYVSFFPFLLGIVALARSPLGRGRSAVVLVLLIAVGLLAWAQQTQPELLRPTAEWLERPTEQLWSALKGACAGLAIFIVIPGASIATAALLVLSYALYYPYWHDWTAPPPNWGFEGDAFARIYDFATIFGLFLFIAVPYLFALWRRQLLPAGRERLGWARSLLPWLVGLAILAALLSSDRTIHRALSLPDPASVRIGLVLLGVLAAHLALQRALLPRQRFVAILLSFSFFVTAGVDVVHIWDRMNTVFKFYLEAWFLFALASAAAAYELWTGLIRSSALRRVWQGGLALLIAVSVFTAVTATHGVITTYRVETPRPSLDGTAYLALREPHEAAAYEWLNREIPGIPVIAEAYGPSYQDYARVSMNTGLPTVLGWDYHVHQRAHEWPDINRRKEDLKKLYTTDQEKVAAEILQRYHVAMVFVGKVERREYAGGNLERFRTWADLLQPVYQNAGVTVFAVQGQFTGAMPITTIEQVPLVPAEEEAAGEQATEGDLRQPRGLAADSHGNVYVADFGNDRIQKFNDKLEFVAAWGQKGGAPGQFKQPAGVVIDAKDQVYIADTWNQRIQVFDVEGKYLREWGGAFFGPRGIALGPNDRVYLVDTGNHRVRSFDINGAEGPNWGGNGSEPGQLNEPVGIATDAEGRVYVCDNGNSRVQIFDPSGKLLGAFPVKGWERKVFSEPYMAITKGGTIWVTVPLERAVRAYDREGKLLTEIRGTEDHSGPFQQPMGIALMPGGKELVISDLENRLARIPIPAGIP